MTITRPPWLHRMLNRLGWRLLNRGAKRSPVPFYAAWGQRLLWRYPVPVISRWPHTRWRLRRRHPLLDDDDS